LNAPFIIESWQFWASWLFIRRNTGGNRWSLPLLGYDAAATIPINLGVPGEVDLHQNEAVLVFREKTQNLAPSHQFASGREDNRNA
jgi:hypothetical protein